MMVKWIFCWLTFAATLPLTAWDDSPSCVEQIETTFFNEVWLNEAMSYHYVSQSAWKMINRDILYRAKDIPRQVKAVRERLQYDPFQNPFNGQASWALIRPVLLQNFREVMNFYQIFNEQDINQMFEYIENKQMSRIKQCFNLDEPVPIKNDRAK